MKHLRTAVENDQRQSADRPLQHYQPHSHAKRNADATNKDPHRLVEVFGPIGLGGEAAGAHAQETEVPVYEVEYLCANGNGADVIGAESAYDSQIHHTQQGYGDVGDDVGQGKTQNALVHLNVYKNQIQMRITSNRSLHN